MIKRCQGKHPNCIKKDGLCRELFQTKQDADNEIASNEHYPNPPGFYSSPCLGGKGWHIFPKTKRGYEESRGLK